MLHTVARRSRATVCSILLPSPSPFSGSPDFVKSPGVSKVRVVPFPGSRQCNTRGGHHQFHVLLKQPDLMDWTFDTPPRPCSGGKVGV